MTTVPGVVTRPPRGSRLGGIDLRIVDVIVAVVLAALALAAAASQSPHGLSPLTALSCVAATGSVVWRRRAPVSAAMIAIAALLMLSVLQGARANSQLYDEPIAVLLDFYTLGRGAVNRYGPAVLAFCLLSALVVFAVGAYETGNLAVATVLSGWTISVGLPFAAGRALASRKALTQQLKATAAELQREQEVSASRAASEERNRGPRPRPGRRAGLRSGGREPRAWREA